MFELIFDSIICVSSFLIFFSVRRLSQLEKYPKMLKTATNITAIAIKIIHPAHFSALSKSKLNLLIKKLVISAIIIFFEKTARKGFASSRTVLILRLKEFVICKWYF